MWTEQDLLNHIRPPGQLYIVTEIITVPAGGIAPISINVRKQRGNIQAIGLNVAGTALTELELIESLVTLDNDGVSFLEEDNLLAYSSFYREERKSVIPIFISQAAVIKGEITSAAANEMKVGIRQFFYDPLQNLNLIEVGEGYKSNLEENAGNYNGR